METIISLIVCVLIWLLLNRPMTAFYHARLIDAAKGCPPAEALVKEFLKQKRPTSFGAGCTLNRIARLREEQQIVEKQ